MPKFSKKSLERLSTCHKDLQILFSEVIKSFDCSILEGYRNKADQDAAYARGASKLKWPKGRHNSTPSMAVDAVPFPFPGWGKSTDFIFFGGYVLGIAQMLYVSGKMSYRVIYGGDWSKDKKISNERFVDAVHFELEK